MSAADRDDDGELTAYNNRRYLGGGAADSLVDGARRRR